VEQDKRERQANKKASISSPQPEKKQVIEQGQIKLVEAPASEFGSSLLKELHKEKRQQQKQEQEQEQNQDQDSNPLSPTEFNTFTPTFTNNTMSSSGIMGSNHINFPNSAQISNKHNGPTIIRFSRNSDDDNNNSNEGSDQEDDFYFRPQTNNTNSTHSLSGRVAQAPKENDSRNVTTSSNGKFRTLADLQSSSSNGPEGIIIIPQARMGEGDNDDDNDDDNTPGMLKLYRELGKQRFERELISQGMSAQDVAHWMHFIPILELQQQLQRQQISKHTKRKMHRHHHDDDDVDENEEAMMNHHQQHRQMNNNNNPTAFVGKGHTLNSSSQNVKQFTFKENQPFSDIQFSTQTAFNTPTTIGVTTSVPETAPFSVDQSKPKTSIQIRLHNGNKIVAEFNYIHTISDIHKYLESTPGSLPRDTFQLMVTFPRKILSNHSETVEKAGLINAVIVQTPK